MSTQIVSISFDKAILEKLDKLVAIDRKFHNRSHAVVTAVENLLNENEEVKEAMTSA